MSERTDEFLRGPKWRTRATPARRRRAAAATFALVAAVGASLLTTCIVLLDWLGAPGLLLLAPWWAPTAAAVLWTVIRPGAAPLSDDDDDSWVGYSIRWALVGELEARPLPHRLIMAVIFGAPVAWALLAVGLLSLSGIL